MIAPRTMQLARTIPAWLKMSELPVTSQPFGTALLDLRGSTPLGNPALESMMGSWDAPFPGCWSKALMAFLKRSCSAFCAFFCACKHVHVRIYGDHMRRGHTGRGMQTPAHPHEKISTGPQHRSKAASHGVFGRESVALSVLYPHLLFTRQALPLKAESAV